LHSSTIIILKNNTQHQQQYCTHTHTYDDMSSSADKDQTAGGASGLEIGMAGMNLVSSSNHLTNTNKSRSPIPNSGDSVHSYLSAGTAGSNQGDSFAIGNNNNRPPGLIAGLSVVPSPIGNNNNNKPGHTKSASNSSTAHTATLTPTSSVDGGASNDLSYAIGGGRQQTHSPSNASADHLPGIHNLGSFDTDDGSNHDGLMGLQALRERAQSSPGPIIGSNSTFSSSPREFIPAGGLLPRGGGGGVITPQQQQQQSRPRTITKDNSSRSVTGSSRPPLAGGSALSPHTVDGMAGFQTATAGSRSRDASPPPNAGVISRPYGGNVGGGNESFDSSLRRALSNESIGTSDYSSSAYSGSHHRQGSNDSSHLNSSFSQPSLNMNNSQHRVGGGVGGGVGPVPNPTLQGQGLYQSSHQRSQSQPGPLRSLAGPENYYHEANYEAGFIPHRANVPPSSLENDYNIQQQQQQQHQHQQQDMRYNSHGGGHQQYQQAPRHGRSMSMQHSSYNGEGQDNMGYGGGPRRGSLGQQHDGQMQQHGGGYNERERVGNTNYHRQAERFVSPGNSPMHSSYGSGHNRHPGDTSNMSGGSSHGTAAVSF
jgi:hypothetical protein